MAFRKAKAEQAAIKAGFYGLAGAGKTFTALLCAEGLAKHTKKKIAYVDTERGTDFYCKAVPERKVHPEAFDFDAIYTRSLTEVLAEVQKIDAKEYGVLVLDSITHLWEAAIAAYGGSQTRAGTIPMHAWGKIKKPYKQLINYLLSSPLHVIICGRQGNEWAESEEGELKRIGTKMKAEGETAHEPHILLHFEAMPNKKGEKIPTAITEKDRTGILSGKVFPYPTFEMLFKPILGILGDHQAAQMDSDDAAVQDADALAKQDAEKRERSKELVRTFTGRMMAAASVKEVEAISKEITPAVKKTMLPEDVDALREAYQKNVSRANGELCYSGADESGPYGSGM